jgi:hypothetical protein
MELRIAYLGFEKLALGKFYWREGVFLKTVDIILLTSYQMASRQ